LYYFCKSNLKKNLKNRGITDDLMLDLSPQYVLKILKIPSIFAGENLKTNGL